MLHGKFGELGSIVRKHNLYAGKHGLCIFVIHCSDTTKLTDRFLHAAPEGIPVLSAIEFAVLTQKTQDRARNFFLMSFAELLHSFGHFRLRALKAICHSYESVLTSEGKIFAKEEWKKAHGSKRESISASALCMRLASTVFSAVRKKFFFAR